MHGDNPDQSETAGGREPARSPETYLGDGIYASFDGYQIWLRTERANGWHEIALEPPVFSALLAYVEDLKARVDG